MILWCKHLCFETKVTDLKEFREIEMFINHRLIDITDSFKNPTLILKDAIFFKEKSFQCCVQHKIMDQRYNPKRRDYSQMEEAACCFMQTIHQANRLEKELQSDLHKKYRSDRPSKMSE